MKNNIINRLQLCSMFIILMLSPYLGTGIYLLIKSAGIDSYFSVIIAGIMGILFIYLFFKLLNYEPTLPINKKIIKLFGKNIGFIINFIICIIMFILGIFSMFNLINFIVSQFLPETPFLIIGLLFSTIIIYINIKGIETLTRTSLVLSIINIMLFTIAILSLISKIDINNIKPILEHGIKRPIFGSFYLITMNIAPLFLLLIIPKNNIVETKNINTWITITYIFTIILMFLSLFVTLGNLGIHLASIYQYPEYIVLKRISLFKFLDRIENLVILQWIFGLFILLSTITYYISNNIKYQNKSKLLPIIITIALLVSSIFIFKNNTQFNEYSYNYLPYIRLSLLILFIILGITVMIKKKKS